MLTHSGRVRGFPWQVLFTHPDSQLSFGEGVPPSSHRAEESRFLSCGTRSEVPASQRCTALQYHSCPLLSTSAGCKGITSSPFSKAAGQSWLSTSRPGKRHTSFMEQQRKTPAAAAHSLELLTGPWDWRDPAHQNPICSGGTGLVPV